MQLFKGRAQGTIVDTRVLLLHGFILIFLILFPFSRVTFIFLLFHVMVVSSIFEGVRGTLLYIYNLKWFLILTALFLWLFQDQPGFNTITIFIKLLIALLSFFPLTRRSNPDEIVDSMISLKIPTNFAWTVGLTLRFVTFIYEDIQFIFKIQSRRQNISSSGIFALPKRASYVLSSLISQAIIQSYEISDTLYIRGFQGAHQYIILNNTKMEWRDYVIFTTLVLSLTTIIIFEWSSIYLTLFII